MKRTESGLFVASNFNFLRRFGRAKGRTRTVRLSNGEKAKVWVDDSRTVKQTEHGDQLDALVRPDPVRLVLPFRAVTPSVSASASPRPVRAGLKVRKAG